ncbi:hypothetical protein Fmac_001848 [Flemingia macrophylla]|uniref:HTH myb-type domain-containing protein n=1 Tax=Flemingia macrophylla TaxID=520843 RepID=A0ABD1NI83_9FABA
MGSVPAELSLDLRPTFVTNTITDFLCYLSTTPNASHKKSLLDDFVHRLELELAKIQPFKRELPLCMFLLNDAISALKAESTNCREQRTEPVLKEFIPLKKGCDHMEEREKEECRDKRNWMSSFQLWNTNDNNNNPYDYDKRQNCILENKNNGEERQSVADNLLQHGRNGNGGRGFVRPISTYFATKEEKEDYVINGLSLRTPATANNNTREGSDSRRISCRVVSSTLSPPPRLQSSRKQRRCWSLELHKCFVKALQELGGSEVATPKQIRELMRVDGLTNDEVKSHLQKFRLHTKRAPLATCATSIGGLWRQNDFFKGSSSGSPQGPFQLSTQSGEGTPRTEGDNIR